jgi:hypothetical protein
MSENSLDAACSRFRTSLSLQDLYATDSMRRSGSPPRLRFAGQTSVGPAPPLWSKRQHGSGNPGLPPLHDHTDFHINMGGPNTPRLIEMCRDIYWRLTLTAVHGYRSSNVGIQAGWGIHMSRSVAYETVLRVLGVLLIAAGILKGHQLLTEPVVNRDLWAYRPLLIFQVEFELTLGVWLLSAVFSRLAWLMALACFAVFSSVTCYKALAGMASCGCFGKEVKQCQVHTNRKI